MSITKKIEDFVLRHEEDITVAFGVIIGVASVTAVASTFYKKGFVDGGNQKMVDIIKGKDVGCYLEDKYGNRQDYVFNPQKIDTTELIKKHPDLTCHPTGKVRIDT